MLAASPVSWAHGGGHGGAPASRGYHVDPFGYGSYPPYASVSYYDPTSYSYTPTPAQQEAAQQQVADYFESIRKGQRRPAHHRYIAVETLKPTKEQRQKYLSKRASANNQNPPPTSLAELRCVMVFDTEKREFVGSGCYVVERPPASGSVSKFETISAEFVGQL